MHCVRWLACALISALIVSPAEVLAQAKPAVPADEMVGLWKAPVPPVPPQPW